MPSLSQFDLCQLYADPDTRALICRRATCQYALAVTGSQVTSHLRDKHQVSKEYRQGLTAHIRHHPIGLRDPADIPSRPDGSEAHPELRVYDGFACRRCRFLTASYDTLTRHLSRTHLNSWQVSKPRIDDLYDDVFLQSWTYGALRQY